MHVLPRVEQGATVRPRELQFGIDVQESQTAAAVCACCPRTQQQQSSARGSSFRVAPATQGGVVRGPSAASHSMVRALIRLCSPRRALPLASCWRLRRAAAFRVRLLACDVAS